MSKNKTLSMSEILYRLLHHQGFRRRFIVGEVSGLNISESDLENLKTIDLGQLETAAERIAKKLLAGSHQGSSGLASVFPDALEAWSLQSQEDTIKLVYEFLESDSFRSYNELAFVEKGLCVEEAFYSFMKTKWREGSPLEGIVRDEFLKSLYRTLAVIERPNFLLKPEWVKENGICRYTVQIYYYKLTEDVLREDRHFVLYAAHNGKVTSGEITPLIADILFEPSEDPFQRMGEIIVRHRLTPSGYLEALKGLTKIGLLNAISRVG